MLQSAVALDALPTATASSPEAVEVGPTATAAIAVVVVCAPDPMAMLPAPAELVAVIVRVERSESDRLITACGCHPAQCFGADSRRIGTDTQRRAGERRSLEL